MSEREFPTRREAAAYALGRQEAAAKAAPLTMQKIKEMSQEEVAERLPEVNAVLAKGEANSDD
jgi:hypothetical protein